MDEHRRRLIEKAGASGSESAFEDPFCYHCGQAVSRGQSPCPACGQPLDWATVEGS